MCLGTARSSGSVVASAAAVVAVGQLRGLLLSINLEQLQGGTGRPWAWAWRKANGT